MLLYGKQNNYIMETIQGKAVELDIDHTWVGCIIESIKDEMPYVLLVRDKNNLWGLPGGGAEPGEKFNFTGMREIYEEAGVKTMARLMKKVYSYINRFGNGSVTKYIVCHYRGHVPWFETKNITNDSDVVEARMFPRNYVLNVMLNQRDVKNKDKHLIEKAYKRIV